MRNLSRFDNMSALTEKKIMPKSSILLALSGSEQSYQAAQMAWTLAPEMDANIVALHVVDTRTAWALVKPELICLATGVHEESPQKLISDLREAHHEFADMSNEVALFGDFDVEGTSSLWSHRPVRVELDVYSEDLVVIPTREIGGKRITIFGSAPEQFIHHLSLPNILLYPEEIIESPEELKGEPAKAVALR